MKTTVQVHCVQGLASRVVLSVNYSFPYQQEADRARKIYTMSPHEYSLELLLSFVQLGLLPA